MARTPSISLRRQHVESIVDEAAGLTVPQSSLMSSSIG
jgi:hypothetical protein